MNKTLKIIGSTVSNQTQQVQAIHMLFTGTNHYNRLEETKIPKNPYQE